MPFIYVGIIYFNFSFFFCHCISLHRTSCTSLVKFISKYFIPVDANGNKIVFLVLFSHHLLYQNTLFKNIELITCNFVEQIY